MDKATFKRKIKEASREEALCLFEEICDACGRPFGEHYNTECPEDVKARKEIPPRRT